MHKQKRLDLGLALTDRIRTIQPLCEQELGRKLDNPPKVVVHSRFVTNLLRDVWYPWKNSFTSPVEGALDLLSRVPLVPFSPFVFAMRRLNDQIHPEYAATCGYAIDGQNTIAVFSDMPLKPGTPEFDYFVAHEITHLLTSDIAKVPGLTGYTLFEGIGVYYGEKVAQLLHPQFEVCSIENRRLRLSGYLSLTELSNLHSLEPLPLLLRWPIYDWEKFSEYFERLQSLAPQFSLAKVESL